MSKKPKKSPPIRFTVIFSAVMVGIITFTTLFSAVLCRFIVSAMDKAGVTVHYYIHIAVFLFSGLIVGAILSGIFSRIFIKPLDELCEALNGVICGDYSVRVSPKGSRRSRRLGKRFNQMSEALENIEELNADFERNFSHEFKTPLVSILGFAKMLRDGDVPPEKRSEYLDIIIRESERLAALSGSVLLFSRMEARESVGETECYNITEQIRLTVVMLESKWSAKNITFELDGEDHMIEGSKDLLSHVWINILDNAIKFSPVGGVVTVCVSADKERFTVVIGDNGAGMDEETLKNIFIKYYQGDKAHSTEGNGLGMPIVKKAVELHGGEITVESAVGQGTIVRVSLPLTRQ